MTRPARVRSAVESILEGSDRHGWSVDAVSAVEGCVVEEAVKTVEASTGFSLSDHRLVFRGVCPACIEGASR